GLDQALVLQLLESGVDRAGTRAPDAIGPLTDLLDDLIAVARPLSQQRQRRRPDVTPAHPRPACEPRAAERAALHHKLWRWATPAAAPARAAPAAPVPAPAGPFLFMHCVYSFGCSCTQAPDRGLFRHMHGASRYPRYCLATSTIYRYCS